MTDAPVRHRVLRAAAVVVSVSMLVAACGGNNGGSAGGAGPTSAPTPVDIAEVSLIPAAETATPEAIPSAAAIPSAEVPVGEPPAFEPPNEYVLGADDLAAFSAAYDELFPGTGFDESQFDAVGGHLCTYLMRHADADGAVDLEAALIEADVNEPGYTRGDWLAAFSAANAYYCGEFTVDIESYGG